MNKEREEKVGTEKGEGEGERRRERGEKWE